jgi:hypothetical protein
LVGEIGPKTTTKRKRKRNLVVTLIPYEPTATFSSLHMITVSHSEQNA